MPCACSQAPCRRRKRQLLRHVQYSYRRTPDRAPPVKVPACQLQVRGGLRTTRCPARAAAVKKDVSSRQALPRSPSSSAGLRARRPAGPERARAGKGSRRARREPSMAGSAPGGTARRKLACTFLGHVLLRHPEPGGADDRSAGGFGFQRRVAVRSRGGNRSRPPGRRPKACPAAAAPVFRAAGSPLLIGWRTTTSLGPAISASTWAVSSVEPSSTTSTRSTPVRASRRGRFSRRAAARW